MLALIFCGHSNFDICKIFDKGDQEKKLFGKNGYEKKYCINFSSDCSNCCVVYLLTC